MSLRVLGVRNREGFCLVHVDVHDEAYRWGERHEPLIEEGSLLGVTTGRLAEAAAVESVDEEVVSRLLDAHVPRALARLLASAEDDDVTHPAIGSRAGDPGGGFGRPR
jgi:hypothetical protein